jgi:hypothetical protein
MDENKLKVIFIGGASRSGSTLLDRILGEIEGFFSLGELALIWEEGFAKNMLCGCGKPFKSCKFWRAVVEEAFGGFEEINPNKILELQRSVARIRYIPQLLFPPLRSSEFQSRLSGYAEILERLYTAVRKVANCDVLVDSSKAPPHGFVLREIKSIDLRIVHIIRDSRAVAYSRQRKKRNPAIHWKEAYMGTSSVLKSAIDWDLSNSFVRLLGSIISHYHIIRYEDLAVQPRETILKLLKDLKIESLNLDFFVDERTVNLGPNHTASGNPMRFKHGKVEIRLDEEWKRKMLAYKRIAVTALTWPLLLRYGYFWRR